MKYIRAYNESSSTDDIEKYLQDIFQELVDEGFQVNIYSESDANILKLKLNYSKITVWIINRNKFKISKVYDDYFLSSFDYMLTVGYMPDVISIRFDSGKVRDYEWPRSEHKPPEFFSSHANMFKITFKKQIKFPRRRS